MPSRRPNPRLAKLNHPYKVDDVRRLFGVHPHTVRDWIKAGLQVIDARKPIMIRGRDLRAFLELRRARRKRPCPPGHLYCFACRQPRKPAPATAIFRSRDHGAGQLIGRCEVCRTAMHRRANRERLGAILPGVAVRIVEAEPRLDEPARPSLNLHIEPEGSHAKTQP